MPLLHPLDIQCQTFINANQKKATQLIVRLTKNQLHDATEEALYRYLLHYRALPWYQRWWQRLIRPINRLETLYHAQHLSRMINQSNPNELLNALKEAKSQLRWYSRLYFSISTALRLLAQKKDLFMPKQENSSELPQEAVENPINASQDMALVPSSSSDNVKPSSQLSLHLTPELLAACGALDIKTDRPITWAQIRQAYLRLSLRHHPDKNQGNNGVDAQLIFQHIQEAYEALEEYYTQLNNTNSSAPHETTWGDILARLQRLQRAIDELERNDKRRLEELKRNDELALKAYQEAIEIEFGQKNSELKTQIQAQGTQIQAQGTQIQAQGTQIQAQEQRLQAIMARLSQVEQKQSSPQPSDEAADQPMTSPVFFKRGIG